MKPRELFRKWLDEEARARPEDAEVLEQVLRRGRAARVPWALATVAAAGIAAVALVAVRARPPPAPGEIYLYVNETGAPESEALVLQVETPKEKP